MTERIDGEFHFAEWIEAQEEWFVCRKSDTRIVGQTAHEMVVQPMLDARDDSARHFIQQGRDEALGEVDAAAERIDSFTATVFYDEDGHADIWTINGSDFAADRPTFTAALLSDEGSENDA